MEVIIVIAILIFSVILHEVAHGYAAHYLGDPTARLAGRLTLNPLAHLDWFGSVLVPALTWFSGGFIFGWAKPVPYNPYNLKADRWGDAYVAAAGPATNLLLAVIFGLLLRFGGVALPQGLLYVSTLIVITNLALMVFNLIPIPPLDGSKIVASLLPPQYMQKYLALERMGFVLIFLVILLAWQFISPLISFLFTLITGVSF